MIQLIRSESLKYKSTYIYTLGLLGMISPVILIAIGTLMVRDDLITQGLYSWHSFTGRVMELFTFLIGPLITSFIAISAVFHEYQSHTMGNILSTPYSRSKIISGKLVYIALFVIGLYAAVALTNTICAILLGFPITLSEVIDYNSDFLLAGVATLVIIPLAMLLTLIFRSFIPAMVISIAGIIPNLTVFHWDKCYLSPWAAPEVLVLSIAGNLKINIIYPTISLTIYSALFLIALLLYFRYSDQY
ncbi:MAG: ABC transporter permease [Methanobacterium sp. ERen5]|nr:MAG: ABC transporter permease [Methanobacterium sp. ERen5]